MRERWRVAVIDSGLVDGDLAGASEGGEAGGAHMSVIGARLIGARRFVDKSVSGGPVVPDPIGHGTAVTRAICSMSSIDLMVGQVLDEKGVCTPAAVAAAICWAVEMRAELIHMSLGLREDRRVLADAVAAAVGAGCVVIASAPARGGRTFPSAYAGVIRATGDARCAEGEISVLGTAQAHFGGCPRYPGHPESGGASIGAANVSAIVVARLAPASGSESVRAQLTAMGRYRGVEKKLA